MTTISKAYSLNIRGKIIDLSKPVIMGIINLSPDSFYSGSRVSSETELLTKVETMLIDGAKIIDIGGYSSRPNAVHITVNEELERIVTPLCQIMKHFPETIVSIDTFRSQIAKIALEEGASMINDISAGMLDPEILILAGKQKTPVILMHMQGNPQNMQNSPQYNNVTDEVLNFLKSRIDIARTYGVNDIIIDPGFGFGKTAVHNFELLSNLNIFNELNCPILAGISRKSMIYKTLNTTPDLALTGTIALNMAALMKGASILRVHDVREASETISLYCSLKQI